MNGRCWIAVAGLLASASAWSLEPDALFAKVVPSVWTVRASDAQGRNTSQGSAVVIGPGRLVTNCHVLARMSRFQVTKDNVSYGGKLEFPDPDNDLCQIRVDNFHAPAVEMADMDTLRVGARVYAIGTPQGLETTLSDGLLSGLRRDGTGQLMFVQTTTPISPGSSGGGLFDVEGRLIGITTFTRRESQNVNFAVPAYRIAEVAERGRQLLEQRASAGVTRQSSDPGAVTRGSMTGSTEMTPERQAGDWFEYEITDHLTQVKQTVSLRVDRVTGDLVVFNGGARVEGADGRALPTTSLALVELDLLTPPGGWAPGGKVMSGVLPLKVSTQWLNEPATYDLTAVALPERIIRVGEVEYSAVRIDMKGWHARRFQYSYLHVPYRATVWYAPALNRVVRFNFGIRQSVNESLELVRLGRN